MIRRDRSETTDSGELIQFSKAEFIQLTKIIEKRSGLHFSDDKRREIQMKLSERSTPSTTPRPYELIKSVRESDTSLQNLLNRLTVGESYFFRNRPHFEALREHIFPQLIDRARKRRSLNIWCAGCSTGEEPYSITILLRESFPELADWNISILATDINTEFLKRAVDGVYRQWSFRGVDEDIIWKYFSKEKDNEKRLHADIKRIVKFKWFNLAEFPYGERLRHTEFDLIICRNVLIYFSFAFANKVVSAFGDVTRPGSYLLVGHSEAFPSLSQLDVIYSNATYYYRYHEIAGERADRLSVAPGPTLAIPGIGVKTIVPHSSTPPDSLIRTPSGRTFRTKHRKRGIRIGPKARATVDIDAKLDQARNDVNKGRISEAFEDLSTLADGSGKLDHRVHFLRSIVADQVGRNREVIKSLKQAIFLDKNFAIGHFYLGVIYQREGQNKLAGRSFRNVKNLLKDLTYDHQLDEAEGMTAGRLREIVEARFEEVQLEQREIQ